MVLMLWGPDRYRQGSCSIWAQSFLQCDSIHPSLRSNSLDASFYLALFFKKTPNFPVFLETSMGQEDRPLSRSSGQASWPAAPPVQLQGCLICAGGGTLGKSVLICVVGRVPWKGVMSSHLAYQSSAMSQVQLDNKKGQTVSKVTHTPAPFNSDWILGFGNNSMMVHQMCLIYVFQVSSLAYFDK